MKYKTEFGIIKRSTESMVEQVKKTIRDAKDNILSRTRRSAVELLDMVNGSCLSLQICNVVEEEEEEEELSVNIY